MSRFDDISQLDYECFDGRSCLLRLVEGMGYRFGRAVSGLSAEHMDKRPVSGAFSTAELICHIGHLVQNTRRVLSGGDGDFDNWGIAEVLDGLSALYDDIAALNAAELAEMEAAQPGRIFYLINGPLSDALWHIGQISTYKRLLGGECSPGGFYKGERA